MKTENCVFWGVTTLTLVSVLFLGTCIIEQEADARRREEAYVVEQVQRMKDLRQKFLEKEKLEEEACLREINSTWVASEASKSMGEWVDEHLKENEEVDEQ